MRAVIIEDEKAATNLLSRIIEEYCPDIKIVGDAGSLSSGVNLIENTTPELVFLDIKLKDEISFDLLDMLGDRSFYLIITTAYDEYAIKAFKYDAIDYILKPYVPKDIISAIRKVRDREDSQTIFNKLNALLNKSQETNRISLATNEGIRLCSTSEIIRLEASGSYCLVYLVDEKLLISKPLAEIERSISVKNFIRVHASHTVNKEYVKRFVNEDGGYIELSNGQIVPLARRRKQNFLNQIM